MPSKAKELAKLLDSNGDVVAGALDNAPDPDLTPYATTTYVDTEISGVSIDALDVNASAPADAIAIDANGRVGIGTTSPSNPLHVLATAAGETTVKIESNQAGAMFVALDVDTDRDCLLQFQEAGTTRWDIFMNGSSGTNPLLIRDDGGTTQGSFDQSGNFKFNSGYGSAATAYGVRAWVNFNGQNNVAVRGSGNVSSVWDQGLGQFRINFSTSMPDTNYAVSGAGQDNTSAVGDTSFHFRIGSKLTTYNEISFANGAQSSYADPGRADYLVVR